MASINQIARERKKAFGVAKKHLKQVDTILEALERHINRVIARKIKIPEVQDTMDALGMAQLMDASVSTFMDMMADMSEFFTDGLGASEAGMVKDWLQEKGWMNTEGNVISFNPLEVRNYVRMVFKSDKAAQDYIDAHPELKMTDIYVGRERQ